ncbi:MAG: hypothetical protein K2J06_02230, partial [Muribaculaceae bacterium]|nr:hypothetical protein [Muribaculaceae bacterium]
AYVSSVPYSPSAKLILLIYLFIGAAIPAVVIIAKWKLNGKLNTIDQAINDTGLQPIAELPASADGLSVIDTPESEAARRYRLMRSNILSLSSLKPGTVIGVTSASRSHSLSADVAANLAASLAATGRRALIIDANIARPELASILKVTPTATLSNDVATGNADLQPIKLSGIPTQLDAILSDPSRSGLIASDILSSESYTSLIATLRPGYDFIVITLPSADDFDALEAGAAPADIVIADIVMGRSRKADAAKIVRLQGGSRSVFFAAITAK